MKIIVTMCCILSIGCGSAAGSYDPVTEEPSNEAGVDAVLSLPFGPNELCCYVASDGLSPLAEDAGDLCFGSDGREGVVVYCIPLSGYGSWGSNVPPSLEQKSGGETTMIWIIICVSIVVVFVEGWVVFLYATNEK